MALSNCLWCEMPIRSTVSHCPECGLQAPVAQKLSAQPRRYGRTMLAVVAVPLMISAALAAHMQAGSSSAPATPPKAVVSLAPPVTLHDPVQQAVWVSGEKAVRTTLGDPSYSSFADSFVTVSAGRVVTLCGGIKGTAGFDSPSGEERIISVFGQASETVREAGDDSFGVLWDRVCGHPSTTT